ncbi:MAG: extracellular metalloproteinase [Acidobacteriota bacterium]|nr:extracellular metalloproteinase [Acidobacteriota bacterium]MDH3523088.1 extracellular metalloproteinase [Acidobacteriota bacterium]
MRCRLAARRIWPLLALAAAAAAAAPGHFDLRAAGHRDPVPPAPRQLAAAARLRAATGALVTWDPHLGVARSLYDPVGYLTPPRDAPAAAVALDFVRGHLDLLGLTAADVADLEVRAAVPSPLSGATHLHFRQRHGGLPVYNATLLVSVNRDGRVLGVGGTPAPDLASIASPPRAVIDPEQAVARARAHVREQGLEPRPDATGEPAAMWLPIDAATARQVWNLQLATVDGQAWLDLNVDAEDGRVWTRFDWVADAAYRVYAQPTESPNHAQPPNPLPPADGRTLEVDPQDATASPFGWHDTDGLPGPEFTIPRGNNVHAYDDGDGDNAPPAVEPECGPPLVCDFAIDLTMDPTAYTDASITNLFYWANVVHDVQYRYGFDEAAGNFQVNNYGHGGLGGDAVLAEAQDGAGANFATPPDGFPPRMQIGIFDFTDPRRDGVLDAGIVVHEYGHGISNRLVGGPANVSCLTNAQQPGEGLSDWWFLAYTAQPFHTGETVRGTGTYVLGQPVDGPGGRPQPYSTDPAVNDYTYESIAGLSIPHGVGSVWAQAAWEVYWALVDHHGFDPDLWDALGGAGNQRMMLYVNEGLENTLCNPAFTDVRDGFIQAAIDLYGGEDVCRMWLAFAAFGLGIDAVSGGPNSTTPINGFAVPAECEPAIFADGFESGDTSAWSATVP